MTKWVSITEAAEYTGIELAVFKRLMHSVNPPPVTRPTKKTSLFSTDKLREWQDKWVEMSRQT